MAKVPVSLRAQQIVHVAGIPVTLTAGETAGLVEQIDAEVLALKIAGSVSKEVSAASEAASKSPELLAVLQKIGDGMDDLRRQGAALQGQIDELRAGKEGEEPEGGDEEHKKKGKK